MNMKVYEAYNNLINNAGIFECYVKSTALATLKDYIEEVSEEKIELEHKSIALFNNIKEKIKEYKVIIIDLEGNISLDLLVLINNNLNIKPILSFNHIYHPFGIIGSLEESELIVKRSLELKNIEPKSYCFVLDYNRYFNEDKKLTNMQFDNQYEITEEELPYEYILKQIDCHKVLIITYKNIKEDLAYYKEYLNKENIEVETYLIN